MSEAGGAAGAKRPWLVLRLQHFSGSPVDSCAARGALELVKPNVPLWPNRAAGDRLGGRSGKDNLSLRVTSTHRCPPRVASCLRVAARLTAVLPKAHRRPWWHGGMAAWPLFDRRANRTCHGASVACSRLLARFARLAFVNAMALVAPCFLGHGGVILSVQNQNVQDLLEQG